jgi:hypothetical protein
MSIITRCKTLPIVEEGRPARGNGKLAEAVEQIATSNRPTINLNVRITCDLRSLSRRQGSIGDYLSGDRWNTKKCTCDAACQDPCIQKRSVHFAAFFLWLQSMKEISS